MADIRSFFGAPTIKHSDKSKSVTAGKGKAKAGKQLGGAAKKFKK